MLRSTALRLLSPAHARLVLLAEEGLDAAEIAGVLGLDADTVGPALEIARGKLAALEAREEPAWAEDTLEEE